MRFSSPGIKGSFLHALGARLASCPLWAGFLVAERRFVPAREYGRVSRWAYPGLVPPDAVYCMVEQAMAALDPSTAQATMSSMIPPATAGPGVPSAAAESAVAANLIRAIPPTRVLVLLNMVTEEELSDPQEYEVCDGVNPFRAAWASGISTSGNVTKAGCLWSEQMWWLVWLRCAAFGLLSACTKGSWPW